MAYQTKNLISSRPSNVGAFKLKQIIRVIRKVFFVTGISNETYAVAKCSYASFKPGSHITVMVPAVPAAVSKAEYDYGTCVLSQVPQEELNLVPGTAGRVESCPRYRRYRTVGQKESVKSLLRWSSS